MLSRHLVPAAFATFLAISAVAGAEEVLDGIAAVVNNDVVTFSQVRELVAEREHQLRESLEGKELLDKIRELRLAAVQELVDRQLVLQEYARQKFVVPDHILDDHVNTIIREQFDGDRQAFIRTLQAQGYTIQRFRKLETDKMIVQAMRARAVKLNPTVSPAKVQKYYATHRAEYSTPEEVKLRMIVFRSDNPDAANVAKDVRAKIVGGADFAKAAEMYSEDSSRESGGDWGWIERSTLNEKLSRAAFSLKVGKVSEPIELSGNYYLLYVEARKHGETKTLGEVRGEVINRVIQEERQQAQQKWIEGLRSKAYVKIY